MAAMIRAGKIRSYGLSNETSWGITESHRVAQALGVPGPITTQNSFSLLSRGADGDLGEALFREKVSLLAYSPLAGGMLTGKYHASSPPTNARYSLFETLGTRFRKPIVREAAGEYVALAKSRGITPVQLALGYVRSRWHVGATIIGATTIAQLEENIAGAQFDLDADTLAAIRAIQVRFPNPAG